jgi:hypothetical protein
MLQVFAGLVVENGDIKFEARSKSEILMFKCSKRFKLRSVTVGFGHLDFEHLNIVSDFDIRISDLYKLIF